MLRQPVTDYTQALMDMRLRPLFVFLGRTGHHKGSEAFVNLGRHIVQPFLRPVAFRIERFRYQFRTGV